MKTIIHKFHNSYLLQRLTKKYFETVSSFNYYFGFFIKENNLKSIIDSIRSFLSFDYMGSAEFEFGAIPEKLKFLIEIAKQERISKSKVSSKLGKVVSYNYRSKDGQLCKLIGYLDEVEKNKKIIHEKLSGKFISITF